MSSSQEGTGNSEELLSLEGEGKGVSTAHSHMSPKDHLPQPQGVTFPTFCGAYVLPTHISKYSSMYYIEQACGRLQILNIPTSPLLYQNISSEEMQGSA